jgi:hypothetical protein
MENPRLDGKISIFEVSRMGATSEGTQFSRTRSQIPEPRRVKSVLCVVAAEADYVEYSYAYSAYPGDLYQADVDRMTYWGKRQDANFWIENARIEWNEAEAPFHAVARLTLLPKSQLPLNAGEATYFDVTGHSTPDSHCPLGALIAPAGRRKLPAERHGMLASSPCDHTSTDQSGYL